jgi:hypothetical protein
MRSLDTSSNVAPDLVAPDLVSGVGSITFTTPDTARGCEVRRYGVHQPFSQLVPLLQIDHIQQLLAGAISPKIVPQYAGISFVGHR